MSRPEDRDRSPLSVTAGSAAAPPVAGTTVVPPSPSPGAPLTVGQHLGGRYEIRGVLGRGGMGEVWLARDVKLQVEVALKAVRPEKLADPLALDRLRAEVRSARAVASPQVCRVYDLIEADGAEYVSMEYVDGVTLKHVLDNRSPLELGEAREIALQLLAGLGAIHESGLVHRDVKPENVMLTRAGRVVLMDFGIAKAVAGSGTVAGTPAYWAPEQAAGAPADPRADVFAAGIVLAEMVSPAGVRDAEVRQALWRALREEPSQCPDTPWSEAIRTAVARKPGERYPSAQALARALEEITHRVTGIVEAQPYPGLASFTEADAEYFFGREAEVEGVWKRMPQRHLLAIAGPSGAGKSSFLKAGLIPAKPGGWAHLICTPGTAPFVALGQALVPEVSRDTNAMRQMLRFEDADVAVELFRRWRGDHAEALVIVDQFEELFTLNPPEVQSRFATLLSRLALEADVHVLLAMRDDFLLRCQDHEGLRPIFSDLIPLAAPTGDALRRALVQPAVKCGYRFEDDALVADMLHAVEGERGALPLLAFAAASLWDRRDRDKGLLSRTAYDAIGGVAGALAQHAEATLDRVGQDKLPLVRELFRNLVTAQGTRDVRDVDELLTVFPGDGRADAGEILKILIDARLLTSYEAYGAEPRERSGRRVEVVHESLLSAWPRLVRWRTEDEGGAQMRDQLRQVARLWEEKGKPEGLLWTGTSFQEYQVWRARYPGGLSEVEETFGGAMATAAGRKRRRRRAAVAAGFAALLAVAMSLGVMWRRSVWETRQREAGQLLALGRLRVTDSPNAALAFATASLDRADNAPARRFAVEALWQGPTALFVTGALAAPSFLWSPDGRWLALGGGGGFVLLERGVGGERRLSSNGLPQAFTPDSRHLIVLTEQGEPREREVWSLPEARLERTVKVPEPSTILPVGDRFLTLTRVAASPQGDRSRPARLLTLDGATERDLGVWRSRNTVAYGVDPAGTWIAWVEEGRVLAQRLDALSTEPHVIGVHQGDVRICVGPWRDQAVTVDSGGEVRIWDLAAGRLVGTLKSPADARGTVLDATGRFLATAPPNQYLPPRSMFLFDLAAPRTAEPAPLLESDASYLNSLRFSPDGSWLTSVHGLGQVALLWSMKGQRSVVLGRETRATVRFADDQHLLSGGLDGALRRWSLDPGSDEGVAEVWSWQGAQILSMDLDHRGRFVAVYDDHFNKNLIVPLDGAGVPRCEPTPLESRELLGTSPVWDPSGRFLAMTVFAFGHPERAAIRVFDSATGAERTLDTHPRDGEKCFGAGSVDEGSVVPAWLPDGRLLTDGDGGLRVWDLDTGVSRQLRPCTRAGQVDKLLATSDSRAVVRLDSSLKIAEPSSLSAFDLASGATREITSHGGRVSAIALDPSGRILVTGDTIGVVRVGPLDGSEPHLLYGHTGQVTSVAVSPDRRRIASGSADGTIRLWPMPDLSKPPLHTLPHDELLAKLRSLTNLRAVRDPSSDSGWKIEIGPFPGWATVPDWQP
jgi:WD40 repeat protein